jgi:hypothetical protein
LNAYDFPALRAQIDMLESINRQQADRIAELEKEVTRLNCGQQDPYTQTKPLDDEEKKEIYMITPEMIGAALGLKPRRRIK